MNLDNETWEDMRRAEEAWENAKAVDGEALEGVTPADNNAARAAKSAADSAAFEAAERLFSENARVNAKLGE